MGRTAPLVRMARLRAGWPVALWPLVMGVMLFNIAWFAAGGTEYEATVRGQWLPVPVGARVLYLPTNSSDVRAKRDRFLGDCRLGVFAGYAVDMSPQRAYVVIDEISLLNEAKLRLVTCEQLRLLGDANGRIIYPFWRREERL